MSAIICQTEKLNILWNNTTLFCICSTHFFHEYMKSAVYVWQWILTYRSKLVKISKSRKALVVVRSLHIKRPICNSSVKQTQLVPKYNLWIKASTIVINVLQISWLQYGRIELLCHSHSSFTSLSHPVLSSLYYQRIVYSFAIMFGLNIVNIFIFTPVQNEYTIVTLTENETLFKSIIIYEVKTEIVYDVPADCNSIPWLKHFAYISKHILDLFYLLKEGMHFYLTCISYNWLG